MTPEQFAYWLQGFSELQLDENPPTIEQWTTIRDHLALVFEKVTPAKKADTALADILRSIECGEQTKREPVKRFDHGGVRFC